MTAKTRKLVENLHLTTVFVRSERVIETYVQRCQCFKSMKSSSCCYYILQEKEENSDIIVLIRHVVMFLYYMTLMCLNDKTVPLIACSEVRQWQERVTNP